MLVGERGWHPCPLTYTAHLSGRVYHQHSPREHETCLCQALLKPEQAPGQAGMGRGGALVPAPQHPHQQKQGTWL